MHSKKLRYASCFIAFCGSLTLPVCVLNGQQLQYSSQHRDHERLLPQTIVAKTDADRALVAQRQSISLAVADFDADGSPDLVTGYATSTGGALTLQRGNASAIAPGARELAAMQRGELVPAFVPSASVIALPVRPDLLRTVDLNGDGAMDLIVAAQGTGQVYLLAGDGKGGFAAPVAFAIRGSVTSLATWSNRDGADFLVAGACSTDTACDIQVLAADGSIRAEIPVQGRVTAMEPAMLNGRQGQDLAVLAGGQVLVLDGSSIKGSPRFETLALTNAVALVSGSFLYDRRGYLQLAVLDSSSTLHIFARPGLDTHAVSYAESVAARRHRRDPSAPYVAPAPLGWSEAETLPNAGTGSSNLTATLARARVSGSGGDDILLFAGTSFITIRHIMEVSGSIMITTPAIKVDSTSHSVAAAVPARMSPDGRQGVIVADGQAQPNAAVPTTPKTYYVNTTADAADPALAGRCLVNTGSPQCTLRDAILLANGDAAANESAGTIDTVNVPSGTYSLTYNNGLDSGSNPTYHIEITGPVNIVGAGVGTTIIKGINDKLFSINSGINVARTTFDTLFSNISLTGGNEASDSAIATNVYGGALDWDSNGTGHLTFSNAALTGNTILYGPGGAIVAFNSAGAGTGALELDNTVVSQNSTPEEGGGIYLTTGVPLILNAATVSSNKALVSINPADPGAIGQGGGIYSTDNTSALKSSITNNSAINGNSSSSDGGGIYSITGFTLTGGTVSNNSSLGNGGGIFFNTSNETANVTLTTMTGNSAVSGGAILVGSSTVSNSFNMQYSRIHGNSASGSGSGILVGDGVSGGTATVTDNWWGCNGPATGAGCDLGANSGGTLTALPYTKLSISLSAATIPLGQTLTATGDLAHDSAGTAYSAANVAAYAGLPATIKIVQADATTSTNASTLAANTASIAITHAITAAGTGTASIIVDGTTVSQTFIGTASDMTVASSHVGNFHPNDIGDIYTLTATNSGNVSTSGQVTVVDTLPAGLTATAISGTGWACTLATLTCTSSSVVAAGIAFPAITLTVSVSSSSIGTVNNNVVVSGGGEYNTANDTYSDPTLIIAPATIAEAFTPVRVPVSTNSAVSFTITNPTGNATLAGIAFTDNLPSGLVVSTPSGVTGSCGGGTISATAGGSSITLTGTTLAGAASCTFSVNVRSASAGTFANPTSVVSSTNGGSGNTATATLTVVNPPSILGAFGAANIQLNASTSLTLTVTNPNSALAFTGLSFNDLLPAGLVVANPSNLNNTCGGTATGVAGSSSISLATGTLAASGSCVVSVNVTGTSPGIKTNSETVSSTEGGTGNTSSQTVTVALGASKLAFGVAPATPIASGGNAGTITVQEQDSANNLVTGANDTTVLTVAGPNGYSQQYSVQAASGVATFNLSAVALTVSGTYTYTATSTGLTQATATEIVNPGAAVSFLVTGLGSYSAPGTVGSITVKAVDSNNNVAAGFTGTVTISSSDPLATLPAPYTYVAGDGGIHVFSVTLNTAGTQTITATGSGLTGSESGIVVADSIWLLNANGTLARLADNGAALSAVGSATTPSTLGAVAIDSAGDVWAVDNATSALVEYSRTGALLSGAGFTGGGISAPAALAIDGSGQVWLANGNGSVSVVGPTGTAVSPASGYQPGTLNSATAIVVDNSGSVWVTSSADNAVVKIIGGAAPVTSPIVTGTTNNTLGTRP